MNLQKERHAVELVLDSYRTQLDIIPEDVFTETPPGGGWSYAEVYSHILQATLGSMIALDRCTAQNVQPTSKGLNIFGHFMLLTGIFPKVKMPAKVADKMPANKISREEARNLIVKCRKRIEEVYPLLKTSLPDYRARHPRIGMLNAKQWFKFLRIHLQHHLKQLKRIENKFQPA